MPSISSDTFSEGPQSQHQDENFRRSTFPPNCNNAFALAAQGFSYNQQFNAVECFSCHIDYPFSADLDAASLRHTERCWFHNSRRAGLALSSSRVSPVEQLHNSAGTSSSASQSSNSQFGDSSESSPIHPNYRSLETRLNSFNQCPTLQHRSQNLAEAGFYHTGMNEETVCWYCNGCKRTWLPGEDPIRALRLPGFPGIPGF